MKYDIQLRENADDGDHCTQAVYLMILDHFMPRHAYTMDEVAAKTGFEINKGSWPIGGMLWFKQLGFEVINITNFDYLKFSQDAKKYLRDILSKDAAEAEINDTNIAAEERRAHLVAESDFVVKKVPQIEDILKALDEGYLVHCGVDAAILEDMDEDYLGHGILIVGYDEDSIIFNDPGLPAQKDKKASRALFDKAWSGEGPELKEMVMYKLVS